MADGAAVTLGVDPGLSGAATLLAPGVACVWAWRERQRGNERAFEVVLAQPVERQVVTWMVPTLGAIGDRVARGVTAATGRTRLRIWQEDVHLQRSISTAIRLGWISGALLGPCERVADGRKVHAVKAAKWRHGLLGLPIKTPREQAKAASLAYMPGRLEGLSWVLDSVAASMGCQVSALDHITDSAGVAEYGQRYG